MENQLTPADVLVEELFRRAPAQPAPLPISIVHGPREGTSVSDLITFGSRRDWILWEMPHQGIPEDSVTYDNIEYRLLNPNDSKPAWVSQRIDAVAAEHPDVTFLYGKEIGVNQVQVVERKIQQASELGKRALKAAAIAVVAAVSLVAIVSVAAALIAVGAVVLATGAVALDPQIVCIVGEEEKWVSLAVWYD